MPYNKDFCIQSGSDICDKNSFFKTLRLVLNYVLQGSPFNGNVLDLVKLITNCELDFKTYVIYTDYAIHLYDTEIKYLFNHGSSIDDVTYFIIYKIKTEYEKNKNILDPFIEKVRNTSTEISSTYNELKNSSFTDRDSVIEEVISLLNKAKELDYEAFCTREKAIRILSELKTGKENLGLLQIENLKFS